MPNIIKTLILLSVNFLFYVDIRSQASFPATNARLPKHYFQTIIVVDGYRKPSKSIKDTIDRQSKQLKNYAVKQLDISFCTPLSTIEEHKDSATITNSHLLLTGNFTRLQPVFGGIDQHTLVKLGIGIRYIYNTGKKGIWFVDAAPFITRDITYKSNSYFRLASTLVYSHNVSSSFNWRLGITKSFLWANRFYLPFIGLRIGRLDKVNLSIQFPRSINLFLPVSHRFILNVYSKVQGGLYNFSNRDSLYPIKTDGTFHFTRYEINTGLRADVRVSQNFNFYIATGFSTRNNITFYSERANRARRNSPYLTYFYRQDIMPTLFVNLGCVIKFGSTRGYYNNRNIYDAVNLNSDFIDDGGSQMPLTPKTKSELNIQSIRDMVDYNDF